MKIRIKFAKVGPVKFVGHLDMLRYFQKLIRRAGIDICYSEGFNPHQKMSFAAPLGVGVAGQGEYLDIDVHTTQSTEIALKQLNEASVPGIRILNYVKLPEGSANAMSSVAAADYFIRYRDGYEPDFSLETMFQEFLAQDCIEIEKETKKSTALVDIKPMIYEAYCCNDKEHLFEAQDKTGIFLKVSTGSANNLKPDLVFQAFYQYVKRELPEFALEIIRLEVYAENEAEDAKKFLPLDAFGEVIL